VMDVSCGGKTLLIYVLPEPPSIGRVFTGLMARMTQNERDEPLEEWLESEPASPFSLERLLECDMDEGGTKQSDFDNLQVVQSSMDSVDMLNPAIPAFKQTSAERPENKICSPSKRIHQKAFKKATVIFIDIQGFTAACARMDVAAVGKWVQDFYDHVDSLCHTHNELLVERRGDCCVCVDGHRNQAQKMLEFAADLHHIVTPTHAVRMGMSTGCVHFLYRENFRCVFGKIPEKADQLQAMTNPGRALVGYSTIEEWAEETQSEIPPVHLVRFKNDTHQHWVAEFNVTDDERHEFIAHNEKEPI